MPSKKSSLVTYYGEEVCPKTSANGKECINKAYWSVDGELSCGVHSKTSTNRIALPKRSIKDRVRIAKAKKENEDQDIEEARLENEYEGVEGQVIVSKLRMMASPPDHKGFLKVFPNFKHGNRKDGLGLPELSPMSLGPVHHTQPDLPPSLTIENLHQFNKVFPSELDKKGNPDSRWYKTREEAYLDPVPHRHKPAAKSAKSGAKGKINKNIPAYSIWVLPDGSEQRLTYFESRQVYCTYYERLAKKTKSFKKLRSLKKSGTNLQIIGYDGYALPDDEGKSMKRIFEKCYLDITKPFGHELVLAALLILDVKEYPWRKYQTLDL